MKLRKMALHRVGQYKDDVIGEFQDGLNVLYGPNEAGKSTFLAALRGMLFGKVVLSDETVATPAGAFGKAWLVQEEGRLVQVERALSKKSPPKITLDDGEIHSGANVLANLFPELAQVEETLFRSVFTFQLSDLREAGKDDTLQKRLYGIHDSGLNPAQIEEKLDEKAKTIFVPRRTSKRLLNQCLQELEDITVKIKQANDKPADYYNALRELADCTEQISQLEEQMETLIAHRSELRLASDLLPELRIWQRTEMEFDALSYLPVFELSAITRIDEQKGKQRELGNKFKVLQTSLRELIDRRELIIVNEPLLAAASYISLLQKEFGAITEKEKQKNKLEEQISGTVKEQLEMVSSLSDFWTEHHLENLVLTTARLEALRQIASDYQDTSVMIVNTKRQLKEKQTDETNAKQKTLGFDLEETGVQKLQEKREYLAEKKAVYREEGDRLEAFHQYVSQLEQLKSSLAANVQLLEANRKGTEKILERRLKRILTLGYAGTLFFAFISIWLFLTSNTIPAIASMVCTVALAVGLSLFGMAKQRDEVSIPVPLTSSSDVLKERISQMESNLERLEKSFVMLTPTSRDISAVVAMRQSLSDQRKQIDGETEQLAKMEQAFSEWQNIVQQVKRAETSLDIFLNERFGILDMWQQKLPELIAPDSPDDVGKWMAGFLREAEIVLSWRRLERQKTEMVHQRQYLFEEIESFCNKSYLELSSLSEGSFQDDGTTRLEAGAAVQSGVHSLSDIEWMLRMVSEKLADAQGAANEREKHEIEIKHKQIQFDEMTEELNLIQAQINEAFSSLHVSDWDSYEQITMQIKQRYKQRQEADNLFRQLLARCNGSKDKLETNISFLEGKTEEDLTLSLDHVEAEINHIREKSHDALNKQGLLQNRIEDFGTSRTFAQNSWEKAALESTRDKLAFDWGTFVIARTIARKARTLYEEGNQPRALQLASAIFCEITDGRYQLVQSRMEATGAYALYVVQKDKTPIGVSHLSRGTKEQLYLAIRIAMVEMFKERGIILPVVLDDPMVNFDSDRTKRYFDVLHRAAAKHQFIYLTCHRKIADFAKTYTDIHILELSGSGSV